MCNPQALAAAGTVTEMASTALGFVGEKRLKSANDRAANMNYFDRMSALQAQGVQIDAADSERAVDEAIAQAQASGEIATTASEFVGAAGQARLRNAASFELSRSEAVNDLNSQNQRLQLGRERKGAEIERISAINRVQKPSVASLALKLGGQALGGATDYNKLKKGS